MTSVGIDFGTTNSLVAVRTGSGVEAVPIEEPPGDWEALGFERVSPSVIALGNERELVFGWEAKRAAGPKLEAVKRLFGQEEIATLGGENYYVEELAALLFGWLKRSAATKGVDVTHAVVTIPANSRGLARYRTKVCAGMAGIEVPALVNEPTAAAMAHAARGNEDQSMLVFDWGGGTLDVTVLEAVDGVFMEQASKGVQKLGGMDFDSRFAAAIKESVPGAESWDESQRGSFRLAVERAKIVLSTQEETNLPLPTGEYRRVTRRMFEDSVKTLIEKARGPVERCLEILGMSGRDVDAIVMVGGTSKVPAVRKFLEDLLERSVSAGPDPMTAVAEGAAVAASILSGEAPESAMYVSTEHALGTVALNSPTSLEFSELIPANHKLPARATGTYHPVNDFQDSVRVVVIEGDPSRPLGHEDNVVLKEWVLPIEEPGPAAEKAVEVTYEYDVDGILHVRVSDPQTGKKMLADEVSFGISRDKRELVQIAKRVDTSLDTGVLNEAEASVTSSRDPATEALLQKARVKVLPFIDDTQADSLRALMSAVENASDEQLKPAREELESELRNYAYLF